MKLGREGIMDKSVKEELNDLKSQLEDKRREYNNKIKDIYKIKNEIESLNQQNNSETPSKISYLQQDMMVLESKLDPLKKEISELERKVEIYKEYIKTSTPEGRRKETTKQSFKKIVIFTVCILCALAYLVSCVHSFEENRIKDEKNLKNGLENYKYNRPMSTDEKRAVEKELGVNIDD